MRSIATGAISLESAESCAVRAGARLQMERSNIVRLPGGQTGLLRVSSRAQLDGGADVEINAPSGGLSWPTSTRSP